MEVSRGPESGQVKMDRTRHVPLLVVGILEPTNMVDANRRRPSRIAQPLAAVKPAAPYDTGEFPADLVSQGRPLFLTLKQPLAVRPVIVDSNVLRDDLRRAIETQQRTAFLTAADSYGLRPFCPDHVPAEVDEHLADWAVDLADPADARKIFEQHYLPVLRIVTVPLAPLHLDEARRISRLREVDPDDVSTAILAIMLDAPVLTRDKPLLRAVHGDDADVEGLAQWLDLTLAGRVMGQTDRQAWAMAVTGELTIRGTIGGVRALIRLLRGLPLPIQILVLGAVASGTFLARKQLAGAAQSTGRGLLVLAQQVMPGIAEFVAARETAGEKLLDARPPSGRDDWRGIPILPDAPSSEALTRLCLYALARSYARSAASLSRELPPDLGVPTGEAKVRAVLYGHPCFYRLPRGRFQVGRPWGPSLPVGGRSAPLAAPDHRHRPP